MPNVLAAVMTAPHQPIEVRELPEPDLEPGGSLLKTTFSEVCGTDVHLLDGKLAGVPYPIIPGHVTVGVLEKIRGPIHDIHGREIAEGTPVTFLDVWGNCYSCWYCLVAKASTRCPSRKVYGITFGVDDGLTGGWAQKLHIKAGTHCIPLDGVDPRLFMGGGCGLPTAIHAIDNAEIQLGEDVLVLGAGPVGLAATALATLRGAASVYCIGAPQARLDTARAMGATDTLDISNTSEAEREAWLREKTHGRGPDVVIEATGAPIAVTQSLRWVREAGRVIVVGQYTDAGTTAINPHTEINRKHVQLRGVWGSDFSHFFRAVQVLKDPRAAQAFSKVDTAEYTLGTINDGVAEVRAGRSIKALVRPEA